MAEFNFLELLDSKNGTDIIYYLVYPILEHYCLSFNLIVCGYLQISTSFKSSSL